MTHIATKLRNRLLNVVSLHMGNKNVAVNHLHALLANVQKSVHGLTKSDICPKDRQNFSSFLKITNNRVIESLQQAIPNCEATVKYLKICNDIVSSYLDLEIPPLERMYRSIFFLRIWRHHIICSPHYTLQNDFITNNAYTCIEINGKSMLSLIQTFRQNNSPYFLLFPIFDSQTCEKTFRQLRSMGTVSFTKINFSLYEIIHMIGRVELQNNIAYFKLSEYDVSFPIDHKRDQHTKIHAIPSNDEVEHVLEEAKKIAIADALSLGMHADNIDHYNFQTRVDTETIENDSINTTLMDEDIQDDESNDNLHLNSPFTTIVDENGVETVFRKSTLVWMLSEPSVAISKDRLRRVQVSNTR